MSGFFWRLLPDVARPQIIGRRGGSTLRLRLYTSEAVDSSAVPSLLMGRGDSSDTDGHCTLLVGGEVFGLKLTSG